VTPSLDRTAVRFGPDGLVVAVVQDGGDGRVLMVGWMDEEAVDATIETGDVHFHSRSRDRLWRKGETSGNTLRVVDLALDCDEDAILVTAQAMGPTCHRGTRSCFDGSGDPGVAIAPPAGFAWLDTLWSTIERRIVARPDGSYTATLAAGGIDAIARKVVEEALEVVLAAKDDAVIELAGGDRRDSGSQLAGELADLLYHTLVLAAERSVPAADVVAVLRDRHRPD
jgi:phosphoribosyl-ATP pyrophosphohydrolase/phosphoribosyl-AMP cyclohydrolase